MVMGDQVLNSLRPIEQCVCVEDVQGVNDTSRQAQVRDAHLWTSSRRYAPYPLVWFGLSTREIADAIV